VKTALSILSELASGEALNFEATTKHLGATVDLVGDLDSLYAALTPLIKSPGGNIDTSDEQLALVSILHEFGLCRILLTKAVLALLRMYRGDSFTDLRRAVESCAFAVRMSKHNDLSRIWAQSGLDADGEYTKYKAYRKAFRPEDVFPNEDHADHDPILADLKVKFDLSSKLIHGSPLGMAGHYGTTRKEDVPPNISHISFFDMPKDSFVSSFFHVLNTHAVVLHMFGQVLKPYMPDFNDWKKEYDYVGEKLLRHFEKWRSNIIALNSARNGGADSMLPFIEGLA
jgi:hypothetical protein